MIKKENEKESSITPDGLLKFRESLDVLVQRGVARDSARRIMDVLEDQNGLGLSSDHIASSNRVLKELLSRPYLFPEDVEEIMDTFGQEERFAHINWEERKKRVASLAKGTTRVTLAAIGIFTTIAGTKFVGDVVWDAYFSPEAKARQEVSDQIKEQERRTEAQQRAVRDQEERVTREQNMQLGLDWSKKSSYNWKLKYLPFDPNIEYVEIDAQENSRIFYNGNNIELNDPQSEQRMGISTNLHILAFTYKKLDGKVVPFLRITGSENRLIQDILLRTEPTDGVDTRVVYAFDEDLKRERYFKIDVDTSPHQEGLVVRMMRPVRKS